MIRPTFPRAIELFRLSLRIFWRSLKPVDSRPASPPAGPQRMLTLAALALPGMSMAAQPEDAQIQYSGYHEGGRDVWRGPMGTVEVPDPIEIDTLHAGTGGWLSDRLKITFDYLQDTWSGATPILTAPVGFLTVSGASAYPLTASFADEDLVPYGVDLSSGMRVPQPEVVHMLSSASAETRRQADFTLTHEWDEAALNLAWGLSDEPDFTSQFGSINVQRDFNQKLTTVSAGMSYTSSDVEATLGPIVDWTDYGFYLDSPGDPRITIVEINGQQIQIFTGERTDWSASAGLTQVLDRNSTLSTGLTFTQSSGFLENPYKLVMFAFADPDLAIGGLNLTRLYNVPENRPEDRNQWTWNASFSRYFAGPAAALHLDYRFSDDDWGIASHTLETSWSQAIGASWLITPRVRYYSQDAADFYQPYFILGEDAPVTAPGGPLDFSEFPVSHYSSDHRLSAFGALSGGVVIRKEFGNGVSLEGGAEYYVHAGDLKLGGGGEDGYADFHYYEVNLALKIDLGGEPAPSRATAVAGLDAGQDSGDHTDHAGHAGHDVPGGLMFAHTLERSGDFMLGYHYMHAEQSGDMLHGKDTATDAEITANGCGDVECSLTPKEMSMNMHMVDVMYAPTDWLTAMAMFQFMDMDMDMRLLEGAVVGGSGGHHGNAHYHHSTGGIGDTQLAALVRLVSTPRSNVHVGLGVSVPTGEVDIEISNGELIHYGMQTGSGTWDVLPSVTYAGHLDRLSWGGQVSGVIRGDGPNDSGYVLGNVFQTTAWTSYSLKDWLSASVRGIYTSQGEIDGRLDPAPLAAGPMDEPESYGGYYWDVGLGVSMAVPGRSLQGDRIIVEWLQPVTDDVHGYQLERDGSLTVSWTIGF